MNYSRRIKIIIMGLIALVNINVVSAAEADIQVDPCTTYVDMTSLDLYYRDYRLDPSGLNQHKELFKTAVSNLGYSITDNMNNAQFVLKFELEDAGGLLPDAFGKITKFVKLQGGGFQDPFGPIKSRARTGLSGLVIFAKLIDSLGKCSGGTAE